MKNQIKINKNELERLIKLNFSIGYNLCKDCKGPQQYKEYKDYSVEMFIQGLSTLTGGNLELHNK